MRGAGRCGSGTARKSNSNGRSLGEGVVEQQHPPGDLLARLLVGVGLRDAEVVAHHLQHRQERDLLAVRLALSLDRRGCPACAARSSELVAEAALADTRLADHPDHRAAAAPCLLERRFQRRQLVAAPHEPS